jgi:saxitoxin biosynthesis operon SxtJ-like protein
MKKKKITKKDLKQFGLVLGGILFVIGFVHFRKENVHVYPWLWSIGVLSIFLSIFIPKALKPLFVVFTKIAHIIGWVNTRIILTLIYYVVITPIGLVLRLVGKDLLDLKIEKEKESYWIERTKVSATKESLEKQF